MLIRRELELVLREAAAEYSVVAVLGPRQSGKTTLTQMTFPHHRYITLEDLEHRSLAQADPKKFLKELPYESGIILDEIQHVPDLLSYIQVMVDKEKKRGYFILTGSHNILLNQVISQSLAGRIALLTLLPLSISELNSANLLPEKIETLVFQGSYPQIYSDNPTISRLYKNYIKTYIERDVRLIQNISNLLTFNRFIKLCAGRIGQILNLTSLANDCGISQSTAKAWLNLLEASYIIFLLHPYYNNFGKRLIKAPKLYFIDTGLACSLLNIKNEEELATHYIQGNIIESCIISDLLKQYYNFDQSPALYFWRDQTGHEFDCILDTQPSPTPLEIKSSKTVIAEYFKNIQRWQSITNNSSPAYVVYGGHENQSWPHGTVLSWKKVGSLVKNLTQKTLPLQENNF